MRRYSKNSYINEEQRSARKFQKKLEELERCSTITVEKTVRQTIPIVEKYIDHDNIVRTRTVYKDIHVKVPENKEVEEEKKRQREHINKDLLKTKEEISKLDEAINETLKKSLLKLKEIASKENQLNKIALKKYENYGYSKKILEETFQEIKNEQTKDKYYSARFEYLNKIKKLFNNTFSMIDSISSNEDIIKEMKDELFK